MDLRSYFALTDDPFRLTPDEAFFYPTRGHVAVREVVQHTIEMGEGIVVVLGEPGTGKTLLLRMLLKAVEGRETVLVVTPAVSPEDLLRIVISDLTGGEPRSQNKAMLLQELFGHVERLASQGRGLLIAIDEAQHTPPETLEQLRLITNFETDRRKLVQLLLVGQPELRQLLETPLLRPFAQRISVVEQLRPLSRKEVEEYILFRLKRAGGGRVEFQPRAVEAIYGASGGIPRLVNKIAGRSLFLAYANKTRTITPRLVEEALSTMEIGLRPAHGPGRRRRAWAMVAAVAAAAALAGGGVLLGPHAGGLRWPALHLPQPPRPPAIQGQGRGAEGPEAAGGLASPGRGTNFSPAAGAPSKERPDGVQGVVKAGLLHVRRGPGLEYPHVCYLQRGDRVEIQESKDGWLRVRHRVDRFSWCSGWVASAAVELRRQSGERPRDGNGDGPER